MLNQMYRFIAELNGYKSGTVEGKLAFGKECFEASYIRRDDLHAAIWLERLYNQLQIMLLEDACGNKRSHLKVPIELDATASMLSYIGALLGDANLLRQVNAICDGTLNDAWSLDGAPRSLVKPVATPHLYGSSDSPADLLKLAGKHPTVDQLAAITKSFTPTGKYGVAELFKNFILKHVNPQETMNVEIGEDRFTVSCNRYKNVGEETVAYDVYDTDSGAIRRIHHTKTKQVPDLEGFKTYFVTLLI